MTFGVIDAAVGLPEFRYAVPLVQDGPVQYIWLPASLPSQEKIASYPAGVSTVTLLRVIVRASPSVWPSESRTVMPPPPDPAGPAGPAGPTSPWAPGAPVLPASPLSPLSPFGP